MFLKRQAAEIGLEFRIECPVTPKKPICILTWVGKSPKLPSIILNSHMDVVPVFEEFWTHKPFDADMGKDGKIYARGSQDMKCVGMQYLAVLRCFKRNKVQLNRTIHVMFVPEEEIGGVDGMREFVHTKEFRDLNAGFSLDEGSYIFSLTVLTILKKELFLGIASPTNEFLVFFAERSIWHVVFKVPGNPGHGSLLLKNTAGEKLQKLLNRFYEFRDSQVKKLEGNAELTIGDVTTINATVN